VAVRASGGALFLSTHSLRPRGGGGRGGGHMNRAKNTKHLLHRRRTVRGFRVCTDIIYYTNFILLYSVGRRRRRRRAIKAPETSARAALPRATNSIHGNRHETFLAEIQ